MDELEHMKSQSVTSMRSSMPERTELSHQPQMERIYGTGRRSCCIVSEYGDHQHMLNMFVLFTSAPVHVLQGSNGQAGALSASASCAYGHSGSMGGALAG